MNEFAPRTTIQNKSKLNQTNAMLSQTISCIIHLGYEDMMGKVVNIIEAFLHSSETNLRYLAFDMMSKIASYGDPSNRLRKYQDDIMVCLKDLDVSVQKQALDLLYRMCDFENAKTIVAELLKVLPNASIDIKEEILLKLGILAEKFVQEYTWYVDVMLQLIQIGGENANEALWYRIVQIVAANEDLKEYATYTAFQALKTYACCEIMVRTAAYLLGEYGHYIAESPGCSPIEQFTVLSSKLDFSSKSTKLILLSTFFKLANIFPEIKTQLMKAIKEFKNSVDVELQQRAVEYTAVLLLPSESMLQTMCQEMPPYENTSILLNELRNKVQKQRESLWEDRAVSKAPKSKIVEFDQVPVFDPPSDLDLQKWIGKLIINPNGVLYEDNMIQIGIKSEYQSNLGKLAIFYGNKLTKFDLEDFVATFDESAVIAFTMVQNIKEKLTAGTQGHQMWGIECMGAPETLILNVSFNIAKQPHSLRVALPLPITKFMSSVELSADDFISKWKLLGHLEAQAIAPPKDAIVTHTKSLLEKLNIKVLEGVDSSMANIAGASIANVTEFGKVGCLIRIECSTSVFDCNPGISHYR
jgi:AP-2 complex subunit alpha